PGVQRRRPDAGQLGLELGPQVRVGAGEVEVIQYRPDIEAGPADQQGRATPGEDVVDRGAGQALVNGDAGRLGDVPNVQYMVRDAGSLGDRELGRTDVEPPVELHRVGV